MLRLLYDSESNGFVANATKLHCIGITNVDNGAYKGYRPNEVDDALRDMDKADVLIGHNIARHDNPLLKKLKGFTPRPGVLIKDTLVISRVIFPNLKATDTALIDAGKMPPGNKYKGKHSIGAWGYRLGNPKGDYAALMEAKAREMGLEHPQDIANFVWGEFNEEMFSYMRQDCLTNFDLWKHLNPDQYPQAPLDLEHRVARVCDAMNIAGVPFDLQAAGEIQAELVGKKHDIEVKLKARYGFWYAPTSPDPTKALFVPKAPNKKMGYWGDEGEPYKVTDPETGKTKTIKPFKGYPCTKIKIVEFNPGSSDHLAKVLQAEGWKPTKFTEGGKPAMDEEVIESIGNQFPEMGELATLLMVNKRLSQLVGGASSKYPLIDSVQEDGCIHGVINPMGTITSRGAHMFPNLGQVPSAKKPYGKQFRALFTRHKPTVYRGSALPTMVGKVLPWKFLGADQQGLELRGLAHYLAPLDGGKYAKTVIEGDPHWLHAVVMGLAEGERDKHNSLHTVVREDGSKRFIYAYIYGCGDGKAGEIIYEALLNARRTCGAAGEALYVKFFGEDAVDEAKLKKVGKKVRKAFLTRIEGFGKLQDKLSEQVTKRARVIGLDGRIIPIRSDHSALNFLIQSAGAIVCKQWLVDAFEECERRFGYNWDDPWSGDFVFVLWVHDEVQLCVREGLEEEIGNILVECARKAGDPFGFRVPLDSEWVPGNTWEDTH
ncbi:MAG: DNA polymerase [Hyphomicrobiales bacterium]